MSGKPAGTREPSGYILAVVTIFVFALVTVAFGFMGVAGNETRSSHKNLESQRAFWLAEAGRERALRWMTQQYRPPDSPEQVYQGTGGPDGGSYTVTCQVDTAATYSDQKTFVLDCVGDVDGLQRRVRERVRMTSFAQYAYFTDQEYPPGGTPIWFSSRDVIEGRLHTNGTIRIIGNPRFLGEVTSASDHMLGYPNYWVNEPSDWPAGSNNPYFAEGMQLGVPPIALPTQTQDLRHAGEQGGVVTTQETDLQLGVDVAGNPTPGLLRYRNHTPAGEPWIARPISNLPNRVFYCDDNVYLKGVLDGELTIASHRDIRIVDDVTYFGSDAQGAPLPGCHDLLGLVAEKNIVFVYDVSNQPDMIVDGVLMALDTSIQAEDYNLHGYRGVLTIWGGLIQKYRGAVGYVLNGVVHDGYSKDYHYDNRVTGRTPPAFPLTGVYEEVAWAETWDASYPF